MIKRINQREMIYKYNDTHREKFNPKIYERNDESTVNDFITTILSGERVDTGDKFSISVTSIEPIYQYSEIVKILSSGTDKKNKAIDPNVHDIKDSDVILLRIKYRVQLFGRDVIKKDGVNVSVENPVEELVNDIILPRYINKYYIKLYGTKYNTIHQIVDSSTYNNNYISNQKNNKVTLKTVMSPIVITEIDNLFITDIHGERYPVCNYTVSTTTANSVIIKAMNYVLAYYNLNGALSVLNIKYFSITTEPIQDHTVATFKAGELYINIHKEYLNNKTNQAFVCTLIDSINKKHVLSDMYNLRTWVEALDNRAQNKKEPFKRGESILNGLLYMYDKLTSDKLKTHEQYRNNVISLLLWMVVEFDNLRAKNNMDVSIKRLRSAGEYMAQLYITKFSTSVYRLIKSRKITLQKLLRGFKIQPDYVINKLTDTKMSNLIAYNSSQVNDNDVIIPLKYTYKGISGIDKPAESYRYISPTSIGILDPDSSSSSDPGMSGVICPLLEMDGNYFDKFEEPMELINNLNKDVNEYINQTKGLMDPIIFNDTTDRLIAVNYMNNDRNKIMNTMAGRDTIEISKPLLVINESNNDKLNGLSMSSWLSTKVEKR